jgi:hypothetical protein
MASPKRWAILASGSPKRIDDRFEAFRMRWRGKLRNNPPFKGVDWHENEYWEEAGENWQETLVNFGGLGIPHLTSDEEESSAGDTKQMPCPKPFCEAISYAWGADEIMDTIFVGHTRIGIRRNLWTALQNLRYLDVPRTIWVDAICINQNNIEERGSRFR